MPFGSYKTLKRNALGLALLAISMPAKAAEISGIERTGKDAAAPDFSVASPVLPVLRRVDAERIASARLAEALSFKPDELLVTYSERHTGARFELGALGGGRADAPGLVHVGLGLRF